MAQIRSKRYMTIIIQYVYSNNLVAVFFSFYSRIMMNSLKGKDHKLGWVRPIIFFESAAPSNVYLLYTSMSAYHSFWSCLIQRSARRAAVAMWAPHTAPVGWAGKNQSWIRRQRRNMKGSILEQVSLLQLHTRSYFFIWIHKVSNNVMIICAKLFETIKNVFGLIFNRNILQIHTI